MFDKLKQAVGLQEQEEKGLVGQIDEAMTLSWKNVSQRRQGDASWLCHEHVCAFASHEQACIQTLLCV